jgi:hypothetical protein
VPVVTDASTYGTQWVKWWASTQPSERNTQQWPFPKVSISDACWSRFPSNGKDGIFMLVMALSFWAPAVQSPNEIAFFEEAVTDLHWVIQELIHVRTADQRLSPCVPPLQGEPPSFCQPTPAPCPPTPIPSQPTPIRRRPKPTPRGPKPTPLQSNPTSPPPASSSRPPASSSRPPASSSRPPVSMLGVHTHERTAGKRVVKPTWKAQATQ